MRKKLEERYMSGEISEETYRSILKDMEEYDRKDNMEEDTDIHDDESGWTKGEKSTQKRNGGVSISGSGSVDSVNGEYLKIAGSGKVEGDVDVREMKAAGSCKIEGNIRAESVESAGACKIEGNIEAKEAVFAGSTAIDGNLNSEKISLAGSVKIDGDVICIHLKSGGSTKIEGAIAADEEIECGGVLRAASLKTGTFSGRGAVDIEETVVARVFSLAMNGTSSMTKLSADDIDIRPESSTGGLSKLFERGGSLKIEHIHGTTIYLENVIADYVEGQSVSIGPGCKIGILKSPNARVHEGAKIKRREK